MKHKMSYPQAVAKIASLEKLTKIEIDQSVDEEWWEENYKNTRTPINFFCHNCGTVFPGKLNNIIYNNSNCDICSVKNESENKTQTNQEFIKNAIGIHKDLYGYELITEEWWCENYVGKRKTTTVQIPIVCKKHGVFYQTASSHLQNHGCQICSSSRGEMFISDFLKNKNIEFKVEFTFDECRSEYNRQYRFDFYITEFNLVIEYHGRHHYQAIDHFGGEKTFQEVKKRDEIKEKFILNNGIKFIAIPYWHYDDLYQILNTLLYHNPRTSSPRTPSPRTPTSSS